MYIIIGAVYVWDVLHAQKIHIMQVESVRPARNKFGEALTQNREGNRVYQLKQEKLRNVI